VRAAVLTVSDSCYRGEREDRAGPQVAARLRELGWEVLAVGLAPDDCAAIRQALEAWAARHDLDAILTTGGTGIAPRDVTPEATRAVIERELPGLPELMRAEGLKSTRRAVLSRALAGVRNGKLILNLPGSPRGALESLNAVADLLPHVVEVAQGRASPH
jgi:molybdenum cofactor synthesis domain-containing protein